MNKHQLVEQQLASTCDPLIRSTSSKYKLSLRLSLELFCLLFGQLILKDWLFSSANPYPYVVAIGLSGAIFASFIFLFYLHTRLWLLISSSPIMIWWLSSSYDGRTVEVTLSTGLLALWLGLLPGRFASVKWVGLMMLSSIGLALIWKQLRVEELHLSNPDCWVGHGVGTSTDMVFLDLGARLAYEQGLALVVVLFLLLTSVLLCAVVVLATSRSYLNRTAHLGLSAIGLGLLMGLLATSRLHQPFCTADSVAGTWMLVVSVSATGLAARSLYQDGQELNSIVPLSKWKQQARLDFWHNPSVLTRASLLLGIGTVLFLVCHQILGSRVSSIARSAASRQSTATVPFSQTSQPMLDATVAMEDGYFYSHHGFDWVAMHRALRADLREERVEQGGSTITQQLAKNLFLTNDRTIIRKLEEAAYTVELEHDLSKQRILELYLNKIDYGCGQHGITAAAAYYFHESPATLTLVQSAILVGLVPDPPKTPSSVDLGRLAQGQQTALSRVAFFFPGRYSSAELTASSYSDLDRSVYPFKDAWDRGATDAIPAIWHGVSFFFYANPDDPGSIDHVSASLKPALAAFLEDAKQKYGLTGIVHLGVYNDRTMRQSQTVVSAHAFGQAIDISGFRFRDGSQVQVEDHVYTGSAVRLASIEALLRKHFPIVVGWRDDPLRHQTHFHCEVKGPRFCLPIAYSPKAVANMAVSQTIFPGIVLSLNRRLNLWEKGNLVRQTTPTSCGPASLATVLTYYLGRPTTESEMIDLSQSQGQGTGPDDLEKACSAIGYRAAFSNMTMPQMLNCIRMTNIPVIVSWPSPEGHWVVVVGQRNDEKLLVSNPNVGNELITIHRFSQLWAGGGALMITPPD